MSSEIGENDVESYESEATDLEVVDSFKDEYQLEDARKGDFKRKDIPERLTLVEITQEQLRQVQEELCLINLCWPATDIGKELYLKTLPSSYCAVSSKERLLAWYAENFRRQFRVKCPNRRPLLLMRENECGVEKFVSTTIRRSTLPYPELYTWQGCVKFVSEYIDYEPLDKPLGMPKKLRTPTWMLKFQKGNCFECATFLTSLLLGEGYNAFVVSGYASKEQTLCNTSRIPCPYLPQPDQSLSTSEKSKPIDTSKYQFKPQPDFKSQFLASLENDEKERREAELHEQEEEEAKILRELTRPPIDEYHGYRIHSWVVILPEKQGARHREISEPIFLEPSSGIYYNPTHSETDELYFGVESIWNDQNYWVNMQSLPQGCSTIIWDLNKTQLWEHLLPGEPWTMRGVSGDAEDDGIQQEKHLDMPFSYVDEISISDVDFQKRYPNGMKTIFYKQAKVELYAPYVQTDGLLRRITLYDDYNYMVPIEAYETYDQRSDNLVECKKSLTNGSVVDYYKRGRPDQCKEHRYFATGTGAVDTERILDFYDHARVDGLSRIEMHPNYMTQHYVNRDDFLYYRFCRHESRHVQFSLEKSVQLPNDIHYRYIWNIVEKFHRDDRIRATKDVAIREFAIGENEIRLLYHYSPGHYSRATRTFVKPPLAERGDRLVLNPLMTQGYNPLDEPDRSLDVFYELEKQLEEEDHSISHVRAGEVTVATFLKTRSSEYFTPELSISPFDRQRAIEELSKVDAMTEKIRAQSERDLTEEVDYLKPYLARIGDPMEISENEANSLQEECLKDYKQLLVRRANNILQKFEECTKELEKKQTLLTQNEDLTREEEEQMLEETNEINFKLHVLEVKLNRHKELAPVRYKMLVDRLQKALALKKDR